MHVAGEIFTFYLSERLLVKKSGLALIGRDLWENLYDTVVIAVKNVAFTN